MHRPLLMLLFLAVYANIPSNAQSCKKGMYLSGGRCLFCGYTKYQPNSGNTEGISSCLPINAGSLCFPVIELLNAAPLCSGQAAVQSSCECATPWNWRCETSTGKIWAWDNATNTYNCGTCGTGTFQDGLYQSTCKEHRRVRISRGSGHDTSHRAAAVLARISAIRDSASV